MTNILSNFWDNSPPLFFTLVYSSQAYGSRELNISTYFTQSSADTLFWWGQIFWVRNKDREQSEPYNFHVLRKLRDINVVIFIDNQVFGPACAHLN